MNNNILKKNIQKPLKEKMIFGQEDIFSLFFRVNFDAKSASNKYNNILKDNIKIYKEF